MSRSRHVLRSSGLKTAGGGSDAATLRALGVNNLRRPLGTGEPCAYFIKRSCGAAAAVAATARLPPEKTASSETAAAAVAMFG